MSKRQSKVTEWQDYVGMLVRMTRAAGRRASEAGVGVAGTEDLAAFQQLRDELDRAQVMATDKLRAQGFSWADIAVGLGTTRQGAQQQHARMAARLGMGQVAA